MKTEIQVREVVELSYLERFQGWAYRIDGFEWLPCGPIAGFTPKSDSYEDIQAALVEVAWGHGVRLREDHVCVDLRTLSAFCYI